MALIVFIMAADFTPQGDINLRGVYGIKDATNITSLLYCNATDCFPLNQIVEWNSAVNAINSSFLLENTTHFSRLNSINSSFLLENTTLFNRINSVNSSFLLENTSLFFRIGVLNTTIINSNSSWLSTYNASYKSRIDSVNSSFLLENTTLFNRVNSVNSSLLIVNASALSINTTANIQNLLNSTGIYSTYNATYDASVANNTFNESYTDELYWGIDLGSYNATYAASVANNTFNESYTDALYWGIVLGSYNATYEAYAYNVSLNYTKRVYDNWNTAWITTYNATYVAMNTTANIQNLVNNSINSSNFWGDLDTFNATQMDSGDGITLTILESWFTTLWNVIFGTKDTDDLNEGSTNKYETGDTYNATYVAINTTTNLEAFGFMLNNTAKGYYGKFYNVTIAQNLTVVGYSTFTQNISVNKCINFDSGGTICSG